MCILDRRRRISRNGAFGVSISRHQEVQPDGQVRISSWLELLTESAGANRRQCDGDDRCSASRQNRTPSSSVTYCACTCFPMSFLQYGHLLRDSCLYFSVETKMPFQSSGGGV